MTRAKVSETAFRYPYVIGWTGEAPNPPLTWVPHRGARRLSYVVPQRDDFRNDVLRLRQGQIVPGGPTRDGRHAAAVALHGEAAVPGVRPFCCGSGHGADLVAVVLWLWR